MNSPLPLNETDALTSGKKLGHYELIERATFGKDENVFKAQHCKLRGRFVALKILQHAVDAKNSFDNDLEREAEIISRISNPNVVEVYDIGGDGNINYMVMEYLSGQPLRNSLAGLKLLPALHYTYQIAHGLAAAHASGIAHSALNADNIFLTQGGQIKLVNFSHASFLPSIAKSRSSEPAYRSSNKDLASQDLYDFGVLLAQMIEADQSASLPALRKKMLEISRGCTSPQSGPSILDCMQLVRALDLLIRKYPLERTRYRALIRFGVIGVVALAGVLMLSWFAYKTRTALSSSYEVLRGRNSSGCAMDGGITLGASAHMPTPESPILRFHVRRSDDSAWQEPGELTLYVGDGPSCSERVPNVPKASVNVVIGNRIQVVDLPIRQYDGKWSVAEEKKFWIGFKAQQMASYRASGQIAVIKNRD